MIAMLACPPDRLRNGNPFKINTLEKTMKKLIAAIVLLSASTAAFAVAPTVAKAMADCSCPGCPDCPDGK